VVCTERMEMACFFRSFIMLHEKEFTVYCSKVTRPPNKKKIGKEAWEKGHPD